MARRLRSPSRVTIAMPVEESPTALEAQREKQMASQDTVRKKQHRPRPLDAPQTSRWRSRPRIRNPLHRPSNATVGGTERRRSRFPEDSANAENMKGHPASLSNLLRTPSFISEPSKEEARRKSSQWQTDPAVLEEVRNKLCLFAPPPEITSPPTTTKIWPVSVSFIGIFIVLIVISAGVLVGMYNRAPTKSNATVCSTDDCIIHALELRQYLNSQVSPCDNFYEFVCGNWEAMPERLDSVEDEMEIYTAAYILNDLSNPLFSDSKPRMMFRECTSNVSDSKESLRVFKRFKRERKITWPEEPPLEVHPLDVILDLAINWNMGSWLSLHVVHATKRRPLIVIHRGSIERSWMFQLQKVKASRYMSIVDAFYRILDAPKDEFMSSILGDQFTVIQTLMGTMSITHEDLLPLHDIEKYTTNITAGLWLSLLNKHYKPHFQFSAKDLVLVTDTGLLKGIATLINTVPTDRLVVAIGWTFIQEYAWMTGSPVIPMEPDRKRYLCVKTILSCYGLLPGIHYILKTYTSASRQKVDGILDHIKQRLISLVERSPWIDNDTKAAAVGKLRATVVAVWPPEEVMNSLRLNSLYESFPNTSGVFISTYLNVLKKTRALIKDQYFEEVYAKSFVTFHGLLSYLYFLNQVTVTLTALSSPVYYYKGTLAMNYGGLASSYAKKLVKALDPEGITVTETGERSLWWGKSNLQEYVNRYRCAANTLMESSSTEQNTVFSLIPALELSYDAYTDAKALANETTEVHLKNLEQYSSDKIFFMTYCHAVCSTFNESQHECNVPLMNSAEFAAAFNCAPGTYMNPKNKCTFFS